MPTSVIDAVHVHVANDRVRIRLPNGQQAPEPSVEVIRDGESVVGVIVTCSCGEQTRLRFDVSPNG